MQAANKAYIQKEADSVSIIVMNPSDGAVMAMVDYPEFHLNEPFQLIEEYKEYEGTKRSRNTVTGCGETSVSMIPMSPDQHLR